MSNPASKKQDVEVSNTTEGDSTQMSAFVEEMVDQMQTRFTAMGNSILERMDEMSSRMSELEQSIANIMEQAERQQPTSNISSGTSHSNNNNSNKFRDNTSQQQNQLQFSDSVEI